MENNAPEPIDEKEFKKHIDKIKEVIKQKSVDELRRLIAFYISRIEIGKDDISVILSFTNIVLSVGRVAQN